jgi:hypothetical protein
VRVAAGALVPAAIAWGGDARAVDLTGGDRPLRLDVTETSIVAQHFDAREGENIADQGYGAWLNRLNLALAYGRFTVGTRLDSSVYWLRPVDRSDIDAATTQLLLRDEVSRYRNGIYPAKIWATYSAPGLEITAGDAYVQFGRGLILSMRKIDELGVDTTLRGAKIAWQSDPFAATLVAGLANPSRVDEATGRALFLPLPSAGDARGPQPLFGSDRIIGAEIQAGRGLPITLTTHAVRLTRCAPYRYDEQGRVIDGTFDAPIGSCAENDTSTWLSTVPRGTGPIISASAVEMVGQGIEVPSLWGHGKLYVEGAIQRRHHGEPNEPLTDGNALYGAFSTAFGPVTNTLEIKSYRNFYPLAGAVNVSRASAFNNVQYSTPPTAELITQDSMFGFFNACVDGGRLRTDVRTSEALLLYGTAAYFHTKSEVSGGGCDKFGHTVATGVLGGPDAVQTYVQDGVLGVEWRFDDDQSHLFASGGVRNDTYSSGDVFYREGHVEYAFTKHLSGPFSLEMQGRHRIRREDGQNQKGGDPSGEAWREGENYAALKWAPKWVFTQGFEYTTLVGLPTYYWNGSLLYRITADSNVRLFVGQQRGGLRCVSGVCKLFPAFEGARAEVTVRF